MTFQPFKILFELQEGRRRFKILRIFRFCVSEALESRIDSGILDNFCRHTITILHFNISNTPGMKESQCKSSYLKTFKRLTVFSNYSSGSDSSKSDVTYLMVNNVSSVHYIF